MAAKKKKTQKKKAAAKQPFMVVTDSGQFVKGNILERYAAKSVQESKQMLEDPFIDNYAEMKLVTPLYNPTLLMNLAETNVYHDICCDIKAQDVAGIGYKLEPVGDNPNDANKKRLEEFFDRVFSDNPFTKAQRDKEEVGYCSIELVRAADNENAEPYNMYHVPAHTMRIHKDHDKFCQTRSSQHVWFKRLGYPGTITTTSGSEYTPENIGEPATEIMWNVNYTSRSSYYGRPKVIPAIRAIYGHASLMDYNIKFFENYGVPAYAVFISGNYEDSPVDPDNPTGETRMQQAVREKFAQVQSNPHSTMVFSVPSDDADGKVEIKFERLSVETKEASFRLYRTDNRDEIITAHRVDPHRIGVQMSGPLGGDTAIISRQNYKEVVQRPEQEIWENLINQLIIKADNGFRIEDWRFKFVSFNLEDEVTEFELVKGIFTVGAITPNQVVEKYKEKFPGLEVSDNPYMDYHYVNNLPVEEGLVLQGAPGMAAPQQVAKMLDTLADEIDEAVKNAEDSEDNKGLRHNIKKRLTGSS